MRPALCGRLLGLTINPFLQYRSPLPVEFMLPLSKSVGVAFCLIVSFERHRKFKSQLIGSGPDKRVGFSHKFQLRLPAGLRLLEHLSAITCRGDPNPQFSAEGEALFAWRSAV